MKLSPYTCVDGMPFSITREQLLARLGPPLRSVRNAVALNELDYGHVVYRFQDSGQLEEVTRRAPVLHFDQVAVPFVALEGFIRSQDLQAFERAGFLVSPRYGLAFVPSEPDWVTALAAHCIPTWEALG
ncbi:MAG: hypothetical protein VW687_13865 [Curvibacter sp.]